MPNIKIFHHNDLDGYASAAAIYYLMYNGEYDPAMNFIELSHDSKDEEKLNSVKPHDSVWIVDYSFSENTLSILENILSKTSNVVWIDHHKTSVELVKAHPELVKINGFVLENYSGALLTYLYVNRVKLDELAYCEIPDFIRMISDYDCWQNKIRQSEYFALGMELNMRNIYSSTYETLFKKPDNTTVRTIVERGLIIKKYLNVKYEKLRKDNGFEAILDDHECFVVNGDGNSWVFGDAIDKYPVCALYTFDGEYYKVSIYSSKKTDCSKIAEKFGGGGHPGASGFRTKEFPFIKI